MKQIAAIFIALLIGTPAMYAQKNRVNDAWSFYNTYIKNEGAKDVTYLNKAKAAIDEATVHPDTKDQANTWKHRGNIYLELYREDFNARMSANKDIADGNKRQTMSFQEAPTANLIEATNAYLKGRSLDNKKVFVSEFTKGLADCYYFLQNVGIAKYNQKEYVGALPMFEMAADIVASDKKFDTLNTSNAALSAFNGKVYDKAAVLYRRLADAGYDKGKTWQQLGSVYLESGDSVKYKATIAEGLKKYPTDADLLTEDVNIKMNEGRMAEAVSQLNALIAQRPDDSNLNFIVGNVYDQIANPTRPDGSPDSIKPKNYDEMVAKAAEYYKKAIELNPKNFEANFNLGVLFYNQGVYYYNLSQSTIADAAKYKDKWEKPLPEAAKYLEAAHALNPTDMVTLQALKTCYSQMGDSDNYVRIKEEIKKLQGGQ